LFLFLYKVTAYIQAFGKASQKNKKKSFAYQCTFDYHGFTVNDNPNILVMSSVLGVFDYLFSDLLIDDLIACRLD